MMEISLPVREVFLSHISRISLLPVGLLPFGSAFKSPLYLGGLPDSLNS